MTKKDNWFNQSIDDYSKADRQTIEINIAYSD